MNKMDCVQNQKEVKVYVMSGTNKPKKLDKAVARRYDYKIFIKGPNEKDRQNLIKYLLNPCKIGDEELTKLAKKCDGSSCKEIEQMVRDVIRKNFLQDLKSNFFKKVTDFKYVACEPNSSDPKIIQMSYEKLPKNALRAKPLTFKELMVRFENPIRGDSVSDMDEFNSFEKMYGSTSIFE